MIGSACASPMRGSSLGCGIPCPPPRQIPDKSCGSYVSLALDSAAAFFCASEGGSPV